MQIYIFKNNEQFGPFDAAQIEEYIKTSVFAMEDFAWSEGEPEWIALSDLLLKKSQTQDVEVITKVEVEAPKLAEAKILTKAIAEQFLKNSDAVELSEFATIEDNAAPVLARHKGRRLNLTGLTSLSDTAAYALSQFNGGRINLAGLTSLSPVAAQALTRQDLVLDSLRNLSNATAQVLMKHKGMLLNMPKETRSVIDKLVRAEAQAKAQAKAQAEAHVKLLQAQAKYRSAIIKTILLVVFWAVTPLAGIVLFAVGLNTDSSSCAVAGFIGICLPILGVFVVAALNGNSNPQQRNAQIAMIQRQQMMNKIDDIRSDLSDE